MTRNVEVYDVGIGGWIASVREEGKTVLSTGGDPVTYYETESFRQLTVRALATRPDLVPTILSAARVRFNLTQAEAGSLCGAP